jgi:hypothetical protein
MKISRVLRYWQQMINCRNPRCRYGCAAYPDRKPHGPYYYGNVQDGAGRVRNVYIGADPQDWLERVNDANGLNLKLPTVSAGAPENRLHPTGNKTRAAKPAKVPKAKTPRGGNKTRLHPTGNKTRAAKPAKVPKAKTPRGGNKTKPPALSAADALATAFLNKRPTPKDALSYLSSTRDATTIKAQVRRMAMVAHPDKGGTVLQMQAVNAAKDLLKQWT